MTEKWYLNEPRVLRLYEVVCADCNKRYRTPVSNALPNACPYCGYMGPPTITQEEYVELTLIQAIRKACGAPHINLRKKLRERELLAYDFGALNLTRKGKEALEAWERTHEKS